MCGTFTENVLDGGELRLQLQRHIPRLNIRVVIWQRLARQTKLSPQKLAPRNTFLLVAAVSMKKGRSQGRRGGVST